MSLHVSNQTTGRRSTQGYPSGFGAPPANSATGANNSTPTNGSGGGGSGGGGRSSKGGSGGKQSMIPVLASTPVASNSESAAVGANTTTSHLPQWQKLQQQYQQDHQQQLILAKQQQQQQQIQQQQQQQQSATAQQGGSVAKETKKQANTNGSSNNGTANGSTDKGAATTGSPAAQPAVPETVPKVRDSPRSSGRSITPQQQQKQPVATEQANVAGTPPKTPEKQKQPPSSASNSGSKQQQQQQVEQQLDEIKTPAAASASLLAEKPLHGFDGEEMESLLLEPCENEESPSKQDEGTRIIRYMEGPPDAGTPSKSATVADASPKEAVGEGAIDVSLISRPLRSISGRRSTRPIANIMLTYRRSTELNDSVSSMNVTVGSDIHNDSLRTPLSASRKRKDLSPQSIAAGGGVAGGAEGIESPKRARLDFSGFFDMVSTPVTMLKNRLSRVRLHTPGTPATLGETEQPLATALEEETSAAVPVTTATLADDEAAATAAGANDSNKSTMQVDAAEEQLTDDKKGEKVEAGTGESSDAAVVEEGEEVLVKDVTDKQKQWCSIM